MKTTKIENPPQMWWAGDNRVAKYMPPVDKAISRHVPRGDAWTDIYNRAYEAVYQAICDYSGEDDFFCDRPSCLFYRGK